MLFKGLFSVNSPHPKSQDPGVGASGWLAAPRNYLVWDPSASVLHWSQSGSRRRDSAFGGAERVNQRECRRPFDISKSIDYPGRLPPALPSSVPMCGWVSEAPPSRSDAPGGEGTPTEPHSVRLRALPGRQPNNQRSRV